MLILILVALWLVVLTPAFIKRHLERRSTVSIDSFHRSLHLLERTGPKLVNPAYRLDTARSTTGLAPGQSGWPPVSSTPGRPNLVLLRPVDDGDGPPDAVAVNGGDEVVDEVSGQHYLRVHPSPTDPVGMAGVGGRRNGGFGTGSDAPPSLASRTGEYRAEQARRRRRDILLALAVTVTLTALVGIVQALHPLWIITVLAGIALAGYVGLAAYAQASHVSHRPARSSGQVPAERGYRRPTRRQPTEWAGTGVDVGRLDDGEYWDWESDADHGRSDDLHRAAVAGFPGAWDDDYQGAVGVGGGGDGYDYDGYDEDYYEPRRAAGGG